MAFRPVSPQVDFPELEKEILKLWQDRGIVKKYLEKNQNSKNKFSFLDGPITANNPMGVHHAWGRTYKDLWQRYFTMKGYAGRFQNGFDCQGLWVEVEVEKELGFKSKKDIEEYGVANFVNKCKDRVLKYANIQTNQSQRLGYFMDWDNSYFTMSDENNYSIWGFLKECWHRGWLYKGQDSVPWCPRCETAISQHEILTEDYKEVAHESIYLALPIKDKSDEFLLVWTTTPWTLPANIAVAIDTKINYSLVQGTTGRNYWLAADLVASVFKDNYKKILKTVKGDRLVGLKYIGPFDHLSAVAKVASNFEKFHTVVATDNQLMPIVTTEGTGLVHTAVSAGEEDFKLGKKLGLPMIPVISDNAHYLEGLGEFSGKNAKSEPRVILDYLQDLDRKGGNWVFDIVPFQHRYPVCWRCKTELVWKVADEWYIAMDNADPTDHKKRTYRQQMVSVAKQIHWIPEFGLSRELDWLNNMHDWLISKKNRYWGLALPIYECASCQNFEVLGSKDELQARAISGWEKFAGNSPHKPWIDEVKISCSKCGMPTSRVSDVGNPWLDAGIVAASTLPNDWFPAKFITESFPGQFKNWFYSLIAMSTVLKKTFPFENVLGFASLLDENGVPMHKSSGNMIEFNEGADKIGVDVMRWVFTSHNPESNLLFGFKKTDEIRRQFVLVLWNVYSFFVSYANIDNFSSVSVQPSESGNILDIWINARLNQVISATTSYLDNFDAFSAAKILQDFVKDLSLWYVRRSRDRIGPAALDSTDKQHCYTTLNNCLIKLAQILAPFMPFVSDEVYTNLSHEESVHLSNWPTSPKLTPEQLDVIENMREARKIVEIGLSQRKVLSLKVRQPLQAAQIFSPAPSLPETYAKLIKDELNVKELIWKKSQEVSVELDADLTEELIEEGHLRDLIREVQEARKAAGARLDQQIALTAPLPQKEHLLQELRLKTLAADLQEGDSVNVKLI